MNGFCPNCGKQIRPGAVFCGSCGTRLESGTQAPQQGYNAGQAYASQPAPKMQYGGGTAYGSGGYGGPGSIRTGVPARGWSDRVNDPRILAAMQKSRGISRIASIFFIPLPLLGFMIYSAVTDELEMGDAVKYGAIVSLIFLAFTLYSFRSSKKEKSYEGVVIDKRIQNAARRRGRSSGVDDNSREEYVTVVQTTTGEIKEIKDSWTAKTTAWQYLPLDARFRYHAGLHFPYELYDKAKAPCLYCVGCLKANPVEADSCSKCGLPLLK